MSSSSCGDKSGVSQSGCSSCSSSCSAAKRDLNESEQEFQERQALESALCRIQHKIVVMSGKGGVGKSTVAVNLAMSLALAGKKVGLMDVDIHGPSIPTMLGLEGAPVRGSETGIIPVQIDNLKVISMGFLLQNPDDAVIWRGPMKGSIIKQFIKDVLWDDLDYLIIDSPPGTGDVPMTICQLIKPDGAVVVTTPQKVAAMDVRKSISFCGHVGLPIIGVVENMSGFVCPKCGELTPILRAGGGESMAKDMQIPFLGSIPMDPQVAEAGDNGKAFVKHYADTPTAKCMQKIIAPLLTSDQKQL